MADPIATTPAEHAENCSSADTEYHSYTWGGNGQPDTTDQVQHTGTCRSSDKGEGIAVDAGAEHILVRPESSAQNSTYSNQYGHDSWTDFTHHDTYNMTGGSSDSTSTSGVEIATDQSTVHVTQDCSQLHYRDDSREQIDDTSGTREVETSSGNETRSECGAGASNEIAAVHVGQERSGSDSNVTRTHSDASGDTTSTRSDAESADAVVVSASALGRGEQVPVGLSHCYAASREDTTTDGSHTSASSSHCEDGVRVADTFVGRDAATSTTCAGTDCSTTSHTTYGTYGILGTHQVELPLLP